MIQDFLEKKDINRLEEYIDKFLVTDALLSREKIDKDRCSYTWENLYKLYYARRPFWEKTDFDKYKHKSKFQVMYAGCNCYISGDTLFNFKSEIDGAKKGYGKYEKYKKILENAKEFDEVQKEWYLYMLKFCNKMNYTLHNFGLMSVTGGLQRFKGNVGGKWDRMDSFVYWIDRYFKDNPASNMFTYIIPNWKKYKTNEEKVMAKSAIRADLEIFLEMFDKDIYAYCREMYLITDSAYVEKLIESGKQDIKCGKDVVRYMELAIEYWIMKDKILNPENNIN